MMNIKKCLGNRGIKIRNLIERVRLYFLRHREFNRTFDEYGIPYMPTEEECKLFCKLQAIEDRFGRYGSSSDGRDYF